jgi:protein Tex
MNQYASAIAGKLNLRTSHVEAVLQLFDEGGTVPFIARYRKDKTGAMDEVAIQQVQDEAKRLAEFDDRKAAIIKSITEQGKMTEAIMEKLDKATTLSELEDIYLPYKPKRKTKASVAKENGLEPLALLLLEQQPGTDPVQEAQAFLNDNVKSAEEALQGARDILAERFSEDADIRAAVRKLFEDKADLVSRLIPEKETEAAKFRDYFEYSEPIHKIPSHRILAVLRGFLEGFLRISIEPAEQDALDLLERKILKASNDASAHVKKAIRDSYKRLLQPGLETEMRTALKQRGDEEAINVFAENLRQLLLSSPLGGKRLLAIDPGYRTGCKTVCLDEKGDLLITDVIYIHEPGKLYSAEHTVRHLVEKHGIQAIAIGDGTAGRETEQFIKGLSLGLPVFLVNEDGASIYSASEIAREEFPDQDITVRGAVSIGRRLMDPLAELVKIDPKSIGVGQYQHDVNQFRLKERLDQTVVSCVNQVGVNLNTASKHLLAYVSGINSGIADQIVKYRKEVGRFSDRKQLMKVPRLGEKAFEQCAGFLRIKDGAHPLDGSAVHPEAYGVVERMATDLGVELSSLIGNEELVKKIDPKKYTDEKFGLLTLNDILNELKKPGLDPRAEIQHFEFARIYSIDDVQTDIVVPGIVTNLTRFGAFVDIGVKQDGLVHISEIAHQYISDPSQALKLGQQVMVKVLEVDRVRKRIALSIRQATDAPSGGGRDRQRGQRPVQSSAPKEKDLSNMNLDDALSALKKKFGR